MKYDRRYNHKSCFAVSNIEFQDFNPPTVSVSGTTLLLSELLHAIA